ncbi:MAG: DnaJ C-terminal domain-containing protein [Dichotomicrobium sp.]
MDTDLYKVLGVKRTASDDEIRQAYRRLAKENHPDLHPGDKAAEDKFKRISAAFAILGDPEKRRRYDAGEIDESGQERAAHQYYREYADGTEGYRYHSRGGFEDFGDIFGDIFGRAGQRGRGGEFHMAGMDYRYHLEIDFLEAALGAKKRVSLPEGDTLDITVPAGVTHGQVLRLRGKGGPGVGRGQPGDALIELSIRSHPVYQRDGDDIIVEVPLSVDEAVLGAKVEVPTIHGRVNLTIPKGTSGGQTFRLRGKGIENARTKKSGDQHVRTRLVLPPRPDPELEKAMQQWREAHGGASGFDPRAKLRAYL